MIGEITIAAPGQRTMVAASAFVLKCSHLPTAGCQNTLSGGSSRNVFVRVELTR